LTQNPTGSYIDSNREFVPILANVLRINRSYGDYGAFRHKTVLTVTTIHTFIQ